MTTVRDTLGTGTYFMTYESSKQLLTTFGGDDTHSNPLAVLVAGGLCGIVSWALICMSPLFLLLLGITNIPLLPVPLPLCHITYIHLYAQDSFSLIALALFYSSAPIRIRRLETNIANF